MTALAIASMRSFLFVPGDRPERFDKALASGADCVILDLEDAVHPEAKTDARRAVAQRITAGARAAVRINPVGCEWHAADVASLDHEGIAAVVLPKATPEAIVALVGALARPLPILALVETARGMVRAVDIADHPAVARLLFGTVDYAFETGIEGIGADLDYARSMLVVASTAAGLAGPVDGVTLALDDSEALAADCSRARRLGMAGKLCIHPRQVAVVEGGFAPDPAQLARDRKILAAAELAGARGAFRFEGELVDAPVLERARARIARADGGG